MIFAGFFAGVLFLGLILGDWLYFMRLTPDASRYGCGIARTHDRFTHTTMTQLASRFDAGGFLTLPHGTARFYQDLNQIVIRQQYRLFALGFRTLWPLKGLIFLSSEGDALAVLCRKLTPWSSALLTGIWFVVVVVGMVGALVLLVRRRTIGGVRWSGVGDWDCRIGACFFAVRSHYGCVCVSAGEFPVDDGVSGAPGSSRRSQTAVLR